MNSTSKTLREQEKKGKEETEKKYGEYLQHWSFGLEVERDLPWWQVQLRQMKPEIYQSTNE
jgi:hypothetical protein